METKKRNEITFTKAQSDFILSDKIHTAFVGGFGSGKSFAGTFKTIFKLIEFNQKDFKKKIPVAYYLPTFSLIENVAFPYITSVLELANIQYQSNFSSKKIQTQYGDIFCRSMDNPKMIVGYEVGYSLIDEADILSKKKMSIAFKNIIARNRAKLPDGKVNQTDFVSTPEGFGFLYDFFVKNPSENKLLVKGKTAENKHLPASYIDTLKESYTEQQLQAYLNGDFVNLSAGNVYHTFDRHKHRSTRTIQPNDILHIGIDFNITKMSAVVRVMDGAISTAVAEITKAYDTAQMIEIIKNRYPNHKILVYPDASSKNRRSAGQSDLDLLKAARLQVRNNNSNPRISDRVSIVNGTFLNSKGETINFVNTNQCPELTEAYEQLGYKNGQPDKESGFDHLTDADGYVICGLQGIKKPRISIGSGGGLL